MTTPETKAEREAFEAWWRAKSGWGKDPSDDGCAEHNLAREAWLAALHGQKSQPPVSEEEAAVLGGLAVHEAIMDFEEVEYVLSRRDNAFEDIAKAAFRALSEHYIITPRAVQTGYSAGMTDSSCAASEHPHPARFESSAALHITRKDKP